MEDYCKLLLEDFLKTSFSTVKVLVGGAVALKGQNSNRKVTLFRYVNGQKISFPFSDERFYLRGSVEYTNPQLTVEEVQGIIGTRLLETCANYFYQRGLNQFDDGDVVVDGAPSASNAADRQFGMDGRPILADEALLQGITVDLAGQHPFEFGYIRG